MSDEIRQETSEFQQIIQTQVDSLITTTYLESWKTDRLEIEYDRLSSLDETNLHAEAIERVRTKKDEIASILYQRQIDKDSYEGINDVGII